MYFLSAKLGLCTWHALLPQSFCQADKPPPSFVTVGDAPHRRAGKFMAFPGEHYHNLLSHLASEIYHNRYPVEHGVDILQGVVRTAGPDAVRVRN